MVDVHLHYYLRYNYMFRLSNNSHLQAVHESLENSYTRFNMGCVRCGVWGWGGYEISYVSWRLGGVDTWGNCYYVYMR